MDGYTAAQVQTAERPLLEAGVPLMQRAAGALADNVDSLLDDLADGDALVLVLVGAGNNGGDALFAAADLAGRGRRGAILPVMAKTHERGMEAAVDAGVQLLAAPGASRDELLSVARASVPDAAVVVDGILGTGSAGRAALRGTAREVVNVALDARNEDAKFVVVAVDIPSGLDPDQGVAPDAAVLPAHTTVTFGVYKAGLLVNQGPALAGNVVVADIGLLPQFEGVEPAVRVQT